MSRRGSTARRRIFAGVYAAATIALTVPVAPGVWAGSPLILGLPPSMVWVVSWLAVMFGLILWLYRSEPEEARGGAESRRSR